MDQQHYRPRSVSEIIDGTIRVVRAHFRTLIPLALVGYLPMIVLFALMPGLLEQEAPDTTFLAVFGGLAIPFVFWFVAFEAAMVHAAGEAYLGHSPSAGNSLRFAAGRYWRVFGAFFAKYLGPWIPLFIALVLAVVLPAPLVAILAIAAVVVAVVLFLRLAALPATLLFEDVGFAEGIRRSLALTAGQKWRVFKALVLIYFIWVAIYMVFYLAVMIAFLDSPMVTIVVGQIAASIGYPLFSSLTALLYFDFRIRKEAYDIELMSQALPATAASSTS